MTSMTFHLHLANHANKKGLFPVMLRMTQNRKSKRLRTLVEVRTAEWNKNKECVRASNPNSEWMNEMLEKELRMAKDVYLNLRSRGMDTPEKVKDSMKRGKRSPSFMVYAKERTQEIYDAGGIRNWKKHLSFCNKLEGFMRTNGMSDLLFVELTPALLSKFDNYLRCLPNVRRPSQQLHPNTIQVHLNIFKTLINRAIEIDGMLRPEQNPFMKFKFRGVKTVKEKLNEEELNAIMRLRLKRNSKTWHCRNYFFFSLYCVGIRIGDLIQLRWCNVTDNGRLRYQMGKNHKVRDLVLVGKARKILDEYRRKDARATDYIFPILSGTEPWANCITQEEKDTLPPLMKLRMFQTIGTHNVIINQELDRIKHLAGIDKKISFHISRHSFAKMAKEKGLDNLEVKALMAHSNLATTQKYMGEFDTKQNDDALSRVFRNKKDEP